MTKENVFVKHLLEFLLGLVKVCIFMALMTGTVVASAFWPYKEHSSYVTHMGFMEWLSRGSSCS